MRRRAFTITEMLVVISVITLLMGLLLGGLSRARTAGRSTKQLSDLRQIFTAWTMYAGQSADECLPGFMSEDVQKSWKLSYKMNTKVPGQSDRLNRAVTQTYPWRLMPFLNYSWDAMMGYRTTDDKGDALISLNAEPVQLPTGASLPTIVQPLYTNASLLGRTLALQPSFGYNAYYLGGWWEMSTDAEPQPEPKFKQVTLSATLAGKLNKDANKSVDVIARKVGSVRKPEQMVSFCASTVMNTQQGKGYVTSNQDADGIAWTCPPFLGTTNIWSYGVMIDATISQAIPLPRYTNEIGTGFVDGSMASVSGEQLADMRSWINMPDVPNTEQKKYIHSGKP